MTEIQPIASILAGMLTTVEAAQYTGLHPQSLRQYARNNKIAHVQRGRSYFFRREDLDKLFKVNTHDSSIN